MKGIDYEMMFELHCREIEVFKSEFGHCNVPSIYSADPTLGAWCTSLRRTYNLIHKGKKPDRILSQNRIKRLEGIGFNWAPGNRTKS